MTFSVSFALFGIIYGALLGFIFRLDWRAFCFDQQRPVTLGLVYDKGVYTTYFDRTAPSKFLGFNGMKDLKFGIELE